MRFGLLTSVAVSHAAVTGWARTAVPSLWYCSTLLSRAFTRAASFMFSSSKFAARATMDAFTVLLMDA